MKFALLGRIALLGALLVGCQEEDLIVQLKSLANSGDVSYVCRTYPEGVGVPLSECHPASISGGGRELFGLVTQESTGEVAVINVPLDPREPNVREGVVDLDPSAPGSGFLRVGARPGDIVSSPGGQASFVAVAEPGKPGLFALPTSCLEAPGVGETLRDLTSWPACALPRAPGNLEMVVDPAGADGTVFESCDRSLGSQVTEPASAQRRECAANLTAEGGAPGRRKLLVALPDAGSIAVIDAQWLLDREPGTFEPCRIEAEVPLRVELPSTPIEQQVPEDLRPAPGCSPSVAPSVPAELVFAARPSAFSLADGVLYIADDGAPVIHRLDVRSPCTARETPPLLPRSFSKPARVVTTSEIAVSPLTPGGRRFVYAVDFDDQPLSSLMVFDVSPDSTDRTPLVRPGASYLPSETPDRLRFPGAIQDVTFVQRERPVLNQETGSAIRGTSCNPNPIDGALGTEYQQQLAQYSVGGLAEDLRGVFALVLLSNGGIAFVDLEDFDAPCRRPSELNLLPELDFRGCAGDQPEIPGLSRYAFGQETPNTDDDLPSVTDEVSCRMVQPHRHRSAFRGITSDQVGVHAPALRSFPQLDLPESAMGTQPLNLPKLLAVDFPAPGGGVAEAQVYVGTTLYRRASGNNSESGLVIDPARASLHSLALPFVEPRAHVSQQVVLVYEGALTGRTSGFLMPGPDGLLTLTDPSVGFCDAGVHDLELMRERGERQFDLSGARLEQFAEGHADHVAVTSDFPDQEDSYWTQAQCGRAECATVFGEWDAEVLSEARKFQILDAEQGKLLLSARVDVGAELTKCCFPAGSQYEIRPSKHWIVRGSETGVRHDVVAKWTEEAGESALECVRDCNPLKRWSDPRVFEITCPAGAEGCGAGGTEPGDACELLAEQGGGARPTGVLLDEPAARCIRDTPTERFAVYRGQLPTQPGTFFTWRVAGAFQALGIDLVGLSGAVLPKVAVQLPDFDWLTVIDASSLGLILIDLDDLSVLTPAIN